MPEIKSLGDNDFYTFTQAALVYKLYKDVNVVYDYKCRNKFSGGIPCNTSPEKFLAAIQAEVDSVGDLKCLDAEIEAVAATGHFNRNPGFLEALRVLRLNPKHVKLRLGKRLVNGSALPELVAQVSGPWWQTIWWEMILLSINSALYMKAHFPGMCIPEEWHKNFSKTLAEIKHTLSLGLPFKFIDYGTRRRFSFDAHKLALRLVIEHVPEALIGTSNVALATELGIPMKGTMSHQWFQAHQQLVSPRLSQRVALRTWIDHYPRLGIALSDIFGMKYFIEDFFAETNLYKEYQGIRHDSGNPYVWAERMLEEYEKRGVNATDNLLVFSDGLTFEKARNLLATYYKRTSVAFGIGTFFTNRMTSVKPLKIVVKMVECGGGPVAKVSDDAGKSMCRDKDYEDYIKCLIKNKVDK